MHTVAVINQKGGVGKTTTAVNCAAALGKLQKRVLLIDLDPSGQASEHVDRRVNDGSPAYRVLARGEPLTKWAQTTPYRFDILAGGDDVAIAESYMTTAVSGQGRYVLKEAFEEAPKDRWDIVLVDCPPNLGQLVSAALIGADSALIPLALEAMPLDGLDKLLGVLLRLQHHENKKLRIDGIFATKTNEQTRLAQFVRAELMAKLGSVLLKRSVRVNTDLAAAFWAKKPVFWHAPESNGAADYRALVAELVERGVW